MQRSTNHISYNSVCWSRPKTWCQKEKRRQLSGIISATRRMILTKQVFCATTRGNTTNLFDHLCWYHTAESCTGLILQTCPRPYPPYLKLNPTRFPTVAQITFSTEPICYKLIPTRTQRKIGQMQVLKMKVSQRREWEFWEGASTHEWAHMKYKCLSFWNAGIFL